jgi:5-methylcytosine-specific restriction protein A
MKASKSFQDLTDPQRQKAEILAARRNLGSTQRRKIPKWVKRYVFKRDKGVCQRMGCGERENLTIDHVIPLARGGTDHEDNLQLLCQPCNGEKGDRVA